MTVWRKKVWYPVTDPAAFRLGDIVWVDRRPVGWYEVEGRGEGMLLIRRLTWLDILVRRVRALLSR